MQASFSWSACLSFCPKAPLTSPAQTQQTVINVKKTRALSFIDWSKLFERHVLLTTTRRQRLAWLGANPGNRNRLFAPADSTKIILPCKQQNYAPLGLRTWPCGHKAKAIPFRFPCPFH